MKQTTRQWLAAGLLVGASGLAAAAIDVPGTSNPKLAGMPDGTPASDGDKAPLQSPVLVTGLALQSGQWLNFSASGFADNCGGGCSGRTPDGGDVYSNGAENGISGINAPINALLGVFLGAGQPDASAAPAGLDFSAGVLGTQFTTLAPALKQVFYIGDGQTDGGVVQQFMVPEGATRLFLATHDGYGWYNNSGVISVSVSAVPEPAGWALLMAGAAVLAGWSGRRRAAA